MLLPISSIKPASDPIRKTWDEDKLKELAQSIAEQGLIVPIKVRPHPELEKWICSKHGYAALSKGQDWDDVDRQSDCLECGELQDKFWGEHEHEWYEYEDGEIEPAFPFEVVYGHRRLEAVRRNGVTEIECIVEGLDDTRALLQRIIENELREDVSVTDKAEGYRLGVEMLGSVSALSKASGIPKTTIGDSLRVLTLPDDLRSQIGFDTAKVSASQRERVLTPEHLNRVNSIDDKQLREDVLRKANREQLSTKQTGQLAQSIAAAPSPEARKVLLETEYSPALHDPEHIKARAATYGAHDPLYRTDNGKAQQKAWDNTPEVKMIIDGVINAAKSWTMLIAEIRRMVQVGKMAPEGRQFTANKLRNLAQTLSSFADELEQEREIEHA